jgi:hypothetical protein
MYSKLEYTSVLVTQWFKCNTANTELWDYIAILSKMEPRVPSNWRTAVERWSPFMIGTSVSQTLTQSALLTHCFTLTLHLRGPHNDESEYLSTQLCMHRTNMRWTQKFGPETSWKYWIWGQRCRWRGSAICFKSPIDMYIHSISIFSVANIHKIQALKHPLEVTSRT